MKKHSFLILSVFIALIVCTGCRDEEAALQFSTESISDSNNIQVSYYSLDPGNRAKEYFITANAKSGAITIMCTTHNSIYFDVPYAHMQIDPSFQICDEGHWRADLISPNTVKFTFKAVNIKDETITDTRYNKQVYFSTNTADGEKVTSYITVTRLLKSDEPLDFDIN